MRYTLVYDSGCGPCTRFKEAVSFLDPSRKMSYLGLDDAEGRGLLSGIPSGLVRSSFHLVPETGLPLSGSAAIATLASQLPGGGFPAAAIRSNPFVFRGAKFAYEALSRLHGTGSCAAGGAESEETGR